MQSLKEIVKEPMREYRGGKITSLLADPAVNVFRIMFDQKNELQRLKAETLNHVWVSETAGKLVLTPLDDDLGRIQVQIGALEGKIAVNTRVADDLSKAFADMEITPPLAILDERVRDIREQIERQKQELNTRLVPFRSAAEIAHADMEKIPEVIELRRDNAKSVTALDAEAREIERKLEKIHEILSGVQR